MPTGHEMFRALFETAPDAMIVVDRSGTIVLANPQAARLFGYTLDELSGAAIEMLMPPEVRAAHETHRNRYMDTPRVRPMGAGQELTGQRRDGATFPVEIALSPIAAEKGAYFVASIRDISATLRQRQALARAHYDKYVAQAGQLALESPMDVTLGHLPPMLVEALGVDAVLVVFGGDGRDALQTRAAHGIAAHELDAVLDALVASAADSPALSAEACALALGGAPDCAFRAGLAARLFDVDHSMGWVVALARRPREFEREAVHFMQSVANLLASVVQRTHTQEQLAHAQRLDAVGQLTGGIAHDFNNLLTVISGNLQLLETQLEDRDDVQPIIGSALRAVGRGAELTRKLLAFARRQRLSPRALAPKQLLGELGLMLKRTLGEQVDLQIDFSKATPDVFADHAQLEAALINLALNARDAMPRGGCLRIGVRGECVEGDDEDVKPGEYVVFDVSDTGLGMPPEVLARAFEPFFTTKEQGKGSGLGLSMVYGFVKQSGGYLRTESRLGFGTRIELYLPAAKAPEPFDQRAQGVVSRGHETVLVVEDEPDVRGIATAFLRSLGYQVHAAATAAEARDKLAAHPEIALLFSDVVLGSGPTGAELAQDALRERPNLKVLLTSGYERPAAETEEQPGAQFELLRKPYRREELAAAVRAALDAKKRESDAP
jgi:PAS domain S-box-containing protein